jgi:hypothetical protein
VDTARNTNRRRGQKINVCCISTLQRKLLSPDKRKMATPEVTFFVILFHLFPILSLYHKYNPSPLLRNYKRGGRDRQKEGTKNTRAHTHLAKTSIHTHHPSKKTWDLLPLSKSCNPYYKYSSARQHEQQPNPLDVGLILPEPVYTFVSALHTIRT